MKTIRDMIVCQCEAPLIFTFAFAYKEYLCLECGRKYEFLYVGRAPATVELLAKEKIYKQLWKVIYSKGYFLPRASYKKDKCKKCLTEDHVNHLTEKEKALDVVATSVFKKLITPPTQSGE